MRGHSVICAVGAGTPVVGLSSHDKVGGFLAEVGLADWAVDLDAGRAVARLDARVRGALDDLPAARARVAAALPPLRERARAFHRRIAAHLGL
jgi:polysaccharide pyruvyl transferase WcaK-like protein